jgi:hypothetical protein
MNTQQSKAKSRALREDGSNQANGIGGSDSGLPEHITLLTVSDGVLRRYDDPLG